MGFYGKFRNSVQAQGSQVLFGRWWRNDVCGAALGDMVEASVAGTGFVAGWQLVTSRLVRRRTVRDVAGPWAVAIDFRVRLLAQQE